MQQNQQQRILQQVEVPYQVHQRIRGWKLTSPQNVGFNPNDSHTRKQMYKGEADWSLIADIKNNPRMHIPLFGNGDVDSPQTAQLKRDKYRVDGIMIGRLCYEDLYQYHLLYASVYQQAPLTREALIHKLKPSVKHYLYINSIYKGVKYASQWKRLLREKHTLSELTKFTKERTDRDSIYV